jgi:hypothetical protein
MMFISPPPPVDMVAVSYVRDDTYRFTVTNETSYGEWDPGINLYHGHLYAWGDRNVIVPPHGKWTVTIRFPADGKWSFGSVDSLAPGNADTEQGEFAQRWNHLNYVNVR